MMDKRKACEEMLDAQLEELSPRIGPFRPRADKDAIDGSREDLKRKEAQTRARAEGKAFFHSTASKFNKQSRTSRKMGREVKKS